MKLIRARSAGFCFGVRRALELAEKALEQFGPVCSYGDLIHNSSVVAYLNGKGIDVIGELEEAKGRPVIIRSHGVAPEIFRAAEEQGIVTIDATCPLVRRVQLLAKDLAQQGYWVVVIGEAEHPEVKGILGWAGYQAVVVHDLDEANRLSVGEKIGVLSQTTQPRDRFWEIAGALVVKAREVRIYDTICRASLSRQSEAAAIAGQADLMLVIGGRNSANTCKLAEICRSYVPTFHIENASELDTSMFQDIGTIGVTAGASTPDWIIEEVIGGMTMFEEEMETTPQGGSQESSSDASREVAPDVTQWVAPVQAVENPSPAVDTVPEETADAAELAGYPLVSAGVTGSALVVTVAAPAPEAELAAAAPVQEPEATGCRGAGTGGTYGSNRKARAGGRVDCCGAGTGGTYGSNRKARAGGRVGCCGAGTGTGGSACGNTTRGNTGCAGTGGTYGSNRKARAGGRVDCCGAGTGTGGNACGNTTRVNTGCRSGRDLIGNSGGGGKFCEYA